MRRKVTSGLGFDGTGRSKLSGSSRPRHDDFGNHKLVAQPTKGMFTVNPGTMLGSSVPVPVYGGIAAYHHLSSEFCFMRVTLSVSRGFYAFRRACVLSACEGPFPSNEISNLRKVPENNVSTGGHFKKHHLSYKEVRSDWRPKRTLRHYGTDKATSQEYASRSFSRPRRTPVPCLPAARSPGQVLGPPPDYGPNFPSL